MLREFPRVPGTYALILELAMPTDLTIGRLGRIRFDARFYLYAGSAFGPGGLAARLRHHLGDTSRPHWHVDYLRAVAGIRDIWTSEDEQRMECAWYAASARMRGASPIRGFGSSDCGCPSHLVALPRLPKQAVFQQLLRTPLGDCQRES